MIELLKQQLTNDMTAEDKTNRVREFLQVLALKIMHDKGFLENLAFVGGTALRFLFNLRRFSEDLDFSLINKKGYDFANIDAQLKREFTLHGFTLETKPKQETTVQGTFLKFSGLLKELGLSSLADQKLSIKLEIDSNPPKGWNLQTTLINKVYMVNLIHYDIPSLYASKLHACFFRKYTKGRDFYDLIWYLSKRAKPNYKLLNNGIMQTQDFNPNINEGNFNDFLLRKLETIDFIAVKKDVERFLEDRNELKMLELKNIKSLLS